MSIPQDFKNYLRLKSEKAVSEDRKELAWTIVAIIVAAITIWLILVCTSVPVQESCLPSGEEVKSR
jgi:uncharacterized membrane-anchored protein